jgi:hypothetical protein
MAFIATSPLCARHRGLAIARVRYETSVKQRECASENASQNNMECQMSRHGFPLIKDRSGIQAACKDGICDADIALMCAYPAGSTNTAAE